MVERQATVDRQRLAEALACQRQLQAQIRRLVEIRTDAAGRRDSMGDGLLLLLGREEASNAESTRGLNASSGARIRELLARRADLGREVAESDSSIERLTACLEDLDQRIRYVQLRLSTQERAYRLQRHSLAADSWQRELAGLLQTLEDTNGIHQSPPASALAPILSK
jgi:hypothetical protein